MTPRTRWQLMHCKQCLDCTCGCQACRLAKAAEKGYNDCKEAEAAWAKLISQTR